MRNTKAVSFYTVGMYSLVGVLVGTVAGPLIGMLLTGGEPGMAGREGGFIGFMGGLHWGPVVGLVAGVVYGLWRAPSRR